LHAEKAFMKEGDQAEQVLLESMANLAGQQSLVWLRAQLLQTRLKL
jgi:hypothetical protein